MSTRTYLRLDSNSGSDYDDERYRAEVSVNGTPRASPALKKNRSRVRSMLNRCSLRTVILSLSISTNVILLIFLVLGVHEDCRTEKIFPQDSTDKSPKKDKTYLSTEKILQTTWPPSEIPDCDTLQANITNFPSSDVKHENIFEDLSPSEISSVYGYLAQQPELEIQPQQVREGNHVYSIELHIPNKTDAIKYMDGTGPKPAREARVVVERSNRPEPVAEEYVVGPLPFPGYHYANPRRQKSSVPFRFHPNYGIRAAYLALFRAFPPELHGIVQESYGAAFMNCSQECLILLPQKTSSAYSDSTLVVLTAYYAADFTTINPVDLMFIMKETAKGSQKFELDSTFYAGRLYKSLQEFITAYQSDSIPKTRMKYPSSVPNEKSKAGTMNIRGSKFPASSQAGPTEYEPEGKRYLVTGQHVQYLEWSFYFRMSTASGPQVWDVRWAGERLAYEISLQELAVIYAGANPKMFYSHLSDSGFGLGDQATGLVPGVDCPDHATFLPQTVYQMDLNGPQTLPNAFCLFEHNTGRPLRRHRSSDDDNGSNYGGLVDRVLILRTIIVEYNYDYIFDAVFHQNGAIEIKTSATGYVLSQVFREEESPFGFRIHENVYGAIHHHMINFKIDLDIQGQTNRYETLDFVVDERPWPWYRTGKEPFKQISFRHNLKTKEEDAVLHYNFSAPKYHIVYNEQEKNKFGNHRAYRIATTGFTKQILPDDSEVLRSRRWSKYQMLVTRRKDEEESSSSVFSMTDGERPHVDIDRYLLDNEDIIDQDLVFWVTVGFLHLPHTEDIPNTPTVGAEATISLLPYNYFPECPSVGSRDAIRLALTESKLVVQDYGISQVFRCMPKRIRYSDLMLHKSSLFP